MKMTEVPKPATAKQSTKTKTPAARRSSKASTAMVPPKVVYGLYGLVALSLVLNIFAAITFISYTKSLSAPLAVDISATPQSLQSTAGWLPPGAEEVNPVARPAAKTDLDAETAAPGKPAPQESKKAATPLPPARP